MKKQGFALITVLILMVVLVGIINILFISSLGELKQTRANVQLSQARAAAEAGEVFGNYVMEYPLVSLAKNELKSDISTFVASNKSAQDTPIVDKSRWNAVAASLQTSLNNNYKTLNTDAVNGLGSATIEYYIDNFRNDPKAMALESQVYLADYRIVSTGSASDGRRRVEDKGVVSIPIGKPALSNWLFLVEDAQGSGGFFPTGSVFNGPVHANHNWGFWGAPEFKGTASTADNGAWYWDAKFKKSWVTGDSLPPDTVPKFGNGFLKGQAEIELPTTADVQERAALGMDTTKTGSPSEAEKCAALNLGSKCTVSNGVYLANKSGNVTGGFYVKGDLDVLEMESLENGQQKYFFRQGKKAWSVIVDYTLNTTTVATYDDYDTDNVHPNDSKVYNGVPSGQAVSSGGANGQIYVDGAIKSLKAPGRKAGMPASPADHPAPDAIVPALSRETQLNITAKKKVEITSDLIYECDPEGVTDKPRCTDQKIDTVLGVMSLEDNIEIDKTAPSDLYLWGAYLAGEMDKGVTVEDYNVGSPKGTLRFYGSMIQYADQLRGTLCGKTSCSGYIETFDYDQRFTDGVLAPPNFPRVQSFEVGQMSTVTMSFHEY